MPQQQHQNTNKMPAIVVDTTILKRPEQMSPLGRVLVEISKRIQSSGAKPKSLQEIHRELNKVNFEEA